MATNNRRQSLVRQSTFAAAGGQPVKEQQGVFNQFGVDTRSQSVILEERERARLQSALARNDEETERFAGDHDLEDAGAAFGTLLANRFNKAKLTPEEQIFQEANKRATAAHRAEVAAGMYNDPATGEVDEAVSEYSKQMKVAQEMARSGDQRGHAIAAQLRKDEHERLKTALERRKLGYDTRGAEIKVQEAERKMARSVVDEMATVWPATTDNPNDSFELWIDKDGNAVNPDTLEVMFPAGEWSKHAPMTPKDLKSMLNGEMTDLQKATMPSKATIAKFNTKEAAAMTNLDLAVAITNTLKDAVNPDGTITIMDRGGKVSAGALRIWDNILAAGKGMADTVIIKNTRGGDDQVFNAQERGSAMKYADANSGLFANVNYEKFGIDRTNKGAVTQLNALFVQYAYGVARMNEENGRISDVDFEHAIQQIAANATNPEELRKVLMGDLDRRIATINRERRQFHPSIRHLIGHEDSLRQWNEAIAKYDVVFSQPFGYEVGGIGVPKAGPGLLTPRSSSPREISSVEEVTTTGQATDGTPVADFDEWLKAQKGEKE